MASEFGFSSRSRERMLLNFNVSPASSLRSRYLASVGETFENIIKTTRHALDKATELAQGSFN